VKRNQFYLISIILFSILFGCTRAVDLNNNSTNSNSTGSNNGYSDPSKPTYTPPNNTGDTSTKGSNSSSSSNGKIDSISITATSLTPCATSNELMSFTFNGTNIPSNATYEWYFGDGESTPAGPSTITHTYKNAGTYTLLAKADSGNTILATCTKSIVIKGGVDAPIANFTTQLLNASTLANNFAFNSTSTISSGTIKTYSWDFGDTKTDNTNNSYVTHIYDLQNSAQTYPVILKVTANNGCSNTKTVNVNVPASGSVSNPTTNTGTITSTSTSPCSPSSETFTFTGSTTNVPTNAIYNWDFGDNQTGSGNPVQHQFSTLGTYVVKLTVATVGPQKLNLVYTAQLSASAFGQNVTPVASMQVVPIGTVGNTFVFTSKSTIQNGSITNNVWDFGDNTSSTLNSTPKSYQQDIVPQTFTIKLTSTSNAGCKNTTLQSVTIPAK